MSRVNDVTRRGFLGRAGALGVGLSVGVPVVPLARAACPVDGSLGLEPPDANGLRLPPGFSSRVVATSGATVPGTSYRWHFAPDGGATFPSGDGGWVYVSNSETGTANGAGASAIRFAADGSVTDAYRILGGTVRNCAGGPTPWGTWLSCEEVDPGRVYECNPFAPSQGVVRDALGTFRHEAAAVDPVHQQIYLTEDLPDGLLYRFTADPGTWGTQVGTGTLEAAQVLGGGPILLGEVRSLAWHAVPDPNPASGETPTRDQVPLATLFNGGEGCWYENGEVIFSTTGDGRVWRVDTAAQTIEMIYQSSGSGGPLHNVDNVFIAPCGDVYVAEDPGELRIVAITPGGELVPIVQVTGVSGTELTGPALSPDGSRLYFSEQDDPGTTYEVTGPFAPVPLLGGLARLMLAAALGGVLAWRQRRGR